MSITHEITFSLQVYDRRALRRAALRTALGSKMTAHEWRAMRREHPSGSTTADLVMVMDQGSPFEAGVQIEDSHVQEVHL